MTESGVTGLDQELKTFASKFLVCTQTTYIDATFEKVKAMPVTFNYKTNYTRMAMDLARELL